VSPLEFAGVTKSFGAVRALNDLSVAVERGEMFGIIGPDGAGKTTAIRCACGLLHVDAGRVRIFGSDPIRDRRRVTGAVGYLSQRFSLYGDLTIDENVAFFAEIHGVRDYRVARDRLLEMTQLTRFRERRADRLSGGMKQKLALACTLVHEPELLLLDEPTTGVDPVARREFWKLLSQFRSRGLTIVMATPYLDEAERCSRVLLLHEGRALAIDAPAALQRGLQGRLFEVLVGTGRPPVDLLRGIAGVVDVQAFGDRLHVTSAAADVAAIPERIRRQLAGVGWAEPAVRAITPTLEDVFIGMLEQETSRS
jgi:ABC-2 type transport system ATP-binding protein